MNGDEATAEAIDVQPPAVEAPDFPAPGAASEDAAPMDAVNTDAAQPASPLAEAPTNTDAVRQRLVQQFERWLDRMAAGEPPPEWLPAELLTEADSAAQAGTPESDLYSLYAALTTLSGEIRLQGRVFKQLVDLLAPLSQMPGRLDRIESAQSAAARELATLAEPDDLGGDLPDAEDVLNVLFDLYDRLERGVRNADAGLDAIRSRAAAIGVLQRLLGGKALIEQQIASTEAMRDGYRLTLARLEAALAQWGIERIGAVGAPFDPHHMTAVDVQPASDVPEGTVLEVHRAGYRVHDRVLATARVKVSKAANGKL